MKDQVKVEGAICFKNLNSNRVTSYAHTTFYQEGTPTAISEKHFKQNLESTLYITRNNKWNF